jgi:hypothetical protein
MEAEKAGMYAKGQMGQSLSAKARRGDLGPVVRDNPSTDGSRPESWATPTARDHKSGKGKEDRTFSELTPMIERQAVGRLNPRWVETLMGLPVGWVMPSCQSPVTTGMLRFRSPVTTGLTSSDSSVTELSQPRAA